MSSSSSSDGNKKCSRRSFPLEYKLMIVEEAKTTNNRAAARVHGLNEASIRQWRAEEFKLREALEQGKVRFRLEGAGRKSENLSLPPHQK